jgi:hypothetical protein
MTAISLRQAAAHLSRPAGSPITTGIKVARFSTGHSTYLTGPTALPEQFKAQVGNVVPGPQALAGGFVDFLLGRGARYQR